MNKKAKHIISILLAVILSTLCNISTIFAQNPTISINSLEVNNDAETSKMLSLEEYNIKFNHEEYNHKELSSRAARLSGPIPNPQSPIPNPQSPWKVNP